MLIQKVLRESLRGATLLVIAHRLSSVLDSDRILVMSDGRVEARDALISQPVSTIERTVFCPCVSRHLTNQTCCWQIPAARCQS